jgi:hypothetical protein
LQDRINQPDGVRDPSSNMLRFTQPEILLAFSEENASDIKPLLRVLADRREVGIGS